MNISTLLETGRKMKCAEVPLNKLKMPDNLTVHNELSNQETSTSIDELRHKCFTLLTGSHTLAHIV